MGDERKTLAGWGKEYGIRVVNPDGFDRKDPQLWTRLYTQAEWEEGYPTCTVMIRRANMRRLTGREDILAGPDHD